VTRALITGITGQDGSYLAEFLLAKGYEVHGIIRRASTFNTGRVDHIFDAVHLHHGDVCDGGAMARIVRNVNPHEVYNLAAQSHVRVSFDQPVYTADATGIGALRMLEAIRDHAPQARFYQASSSEMYGGIEPQALFPGDRPMLREESPFRPRSPYACAKAFAHWTTVNYREAYGLFARCGILFNHESPRRGETFVTRKITRAAGRIKHGLQSKLYLGNLDASRDWGFAGDYVEAMWLMLQHDIGHPADLVVATGETHTVREFCELAFGRLGLDYRDYVEHDQRYERPTEVDVLIGYAENAKRILGWEPRTSFSDLVAMMVDADLELARREALVRENCTTRAASA
jgi:GDPmannose 4,6-dehydratase